MRIRRAWIATATVGAALLWALVYGAHDVRAEGQATIRFATFNAAMNDNEAGGMIARLEAGDPRAKLAAEVIQRVRPTVLLLQEIDRDDDGKALRIFVEAYLAVSQNGAEPIAYPHVIYPPSNTGVPTGVDLNGDGAADGPNDAKGFGRHPGQYAFALLSQLPLGAPRTFADLLWRDMPGSLLPTSYYGPEARGVLPLSSKTHLVVDVATAGGPITVIAAHPTPPVFDDRDNKIDWNGRRNADEIRLIVDLLAAPSPDYLVDDTGTAGGVPQGRRVMVMGDLNADPSRGDSRPGAIEQLLKLPNLYGEAPISHRGDATADFGGGMRVDYVLPVNHAPVGNRFGVFWPAPQSPFSALNGASDHRLVWVDVAADAAAAEPPVPGAIHETPPEVR
ncbi:MAG: endonuclease/exonuclease/phosphatase family protein [Pseudomonadota bacterium]